MDSPDEGLAILTKLPFERTDSSAAATANINHHCAIRIPFSIEGVRFAVTNIHFNWRASDIRLDQLRFVNEWIASQTDDGSLVVTLMIVQILLCIKQRLRSGSISLTVLPCGPVNLLL